MKQQTLLPQGPGKPPQNSANHQTRLHTLHQPITTAAHNRWTEQEPSVQQSDTHTRQKGAPTNSGTTHFNIPVHHPSLGHEVQRPEGAVERRPCIVLREGPLLHNLVKQGPAAYKVHDKHGVIIVVVATMQRRYAWVQRHEAHRLQFIVQQSLWPQGRDHAQRSPGNRQTTEQHRRQEKAMQTNKTPHRQCPRPDRQNTCETQRHNTSTPRPQAHPKKNRLGRALVLNIAGMPRATERTLVFVSRSILSTALMATTSPVSRCTAR